jgi:hypothetical protein
VNSEQFEHSAGVYLVAPNIESPNVHPTRLFCGLLANRSNKNVQ